MLQSEALKFTEGCFNGEPASCTFACPYHIDLRSFLKKAARGRWDSCYKDLMNTVGFPSVACSICSNRCETSCQRVYTGGDAIKISEIERACIEYTKKTTPDVYSGVMKEERIAVIGAGIAGLTAAFMLSQKQYNVVIFEKSNEIGGALRKHPDFDSFADDFSSKFRTTRVEFRLVEEVKDLYGFDGFNAVLITTGKDGNDFGVARTRNTENYMTSIPGIFACGEMFHNDLCYAMAEALEVVNFIEAYLLSGKPDFAAKVWKKENCTRIVDHPDAEVSYQVPMTGEVYTKDEAKAEAARCLQCDCSACLNICEFMRKYKKKPTSLATAVYMDSQVRPPITAHTATKAVYACNLCGRCTDACSESVDLPGLFCFSRQNRVERNDFPPAFHDFWIQNQKFFSGEAAYSFAPEEKCEYAFFPGCQLAAANPVYVEKAYEFLHDNFGAGIISSCCGAPSYWGGDKKLLDENTARIREEWEKLGRPTLVTACTSCTKMLKMILPEVKLTSLYTLMDEKGLCGDLSEFEKVSVFDPCSVYVTPSVINAVRNIASRSGTELSDYDSDGQCCGNGGHIKLADFALYKDITRNRAADSEYPYLVYCVNCREVFKAQGKDTKHILEAVFCFDAGSTPHLEEKKRNGIMAKVRLLDKYKNFKFVPSEKPWDKVVINVPEDVRLNMEDKMITDGNVRETVWNSEESGEGFYSPDTETYLGCLVKPVLTYWVEYKKNGDAFDVVNVYCHRMHFRENE